MDQRWPAAGQGEEWRVVKSWMGRYQEEDRGGGSHKGGENDPRRRRGDSFTYRTQETSSEDLLCTRP